MKILLVGGPLSQLILLSPISNQFVNGFCMFLPEQCLVFLAIVGLFEFIESFSYTKRSFMRRFSDLSLKFLILVVVLWFGLFFSALTRSAGFSLIAKRATPIIKAISEFELKNGRPPESLEQLVPLFLARVPDTGCGAYPKFEYELMKAGNQSPWELRIPCSTGFLNWDVFFCWPTKKYPDLTYGGVVERIDDWAYVHE